MILSDKEKKRLIDNLTWPITDMKHKFDEAKGNLPHSGEVSDYSPELTELMTLLEDIKKTETVEVTGCHRKVVAVNCREFTSGTRKGCTNNRLGLCILAKITLERVGSCIVGMLKCVQAEEDEGDESAENHNNRIDENKTKTLPA